MDAGALVAWERLVSSRFRRPNQASLWSNYCILGAREVLGEQWKPVRIGWWKMDPLYRRHMRWELGTTRKSLLALGLFS